ncbi:hypothetical protein OEA41_005262 [Lepraria neglecta]|uniref:Glutaredoxin domain-containing protein n=1 Tax=Lepraria neglecta TaxID=209136 RepID=A0AAD9YZG7_9LECA|nr:hypothetical protein OEA41_005262 [Lepraria neglecta]
MKVLAIVLAIIVCTILYLCNDSSSQDFYSRTVAALDRKDASDQELAQKLQAVKDAAKTQNPDAVAAPQKPIAVEPEDKKATDADVPLASEVGGSDKGTGSTTEEGRKSVAGRKTIKGGESKDVHSGKEAPKYPDPSKEKEGEEKEEGKKTEEEHEIETELNAILKKGPSVSFRLADGLIIFSKSYCPYSAKAKRILLEKYTIVPAPYVVELDKHPLGPGLQAALGKSTGRRTVPNILVNGRSIGGGDDIEALDESGGLLEKVTGMAGKRIVEAKRSEEK